MPTDLDKRRIPFSWLVVLPLHSHSYVQMSDRRPTSTKPPLKPSLPPGRPTTSKPVVQAQAQAGSAPGRPGGPGSSSTKSGQESSTAVPSSKPSSLLNTLIKPTTEGYPATEVIKYLIEVVGRDVVSFRRNAQVSFMLVERARDICDAINIHIKKTESGTDWSSFEKFCDALDPVEE